MEKSNPPPAYSDIPPEGQNQFGYGPPVQQPYPPGYGYPQNTGQAPAQAGYQQQQGYAQYAYAPAQPGFPAQQYQYSNVVVHQPMMQTPRGPPPPDHMCGAIFVTLCCFWPTGIVAIMRASDARSALARGDVAGAQSYAASAKSMITISVIIGVICFVVMAVLMGVYFGVILSSINSDRDFD